MKTHKITLLFTIISIALLNSCVKDETFVFEKTPNLSDKLRLDGYYYTVDSIYNDMVVYVLYNDGIVQFFGSGKNHDYFENLFTKIDIGRTKMWWGIYLIKNDSLFINSLLQPQGEFKCYSQISTSVILNDTTFQRLYYTSSDGEIQNVAANNIWHFKQYAPKPDSIGSFKFIK